MKRERSRKGGRRVFARARRPATGGAPPPPPTNPVPTTTSLAPSSIVEDSPDTPVVVVGTDFVGGSVVRVNGTDVATSFTDTTHLTATIPASMLTAPGSLSVAVFNPPLGGGLSNAQTFTVTSAAEVPYTLSKPLVYWLDPRRHADPGAGSAAWVYGTMDAVTPAGTTPPTVTLSGVATAAINLRIEITLAGALGVATYRLSLDGGVTFPHTGTTSAAEGPFSGITVAFGASGSYATNNVYTSRVRINAMPSRDKSDGTIGDVNKTAFESTATVQHTLLLNGGANYGNKPVIQCTSAGYMRTALWAAAQGYPCTIALIGQAPAAAVRVACDGLANDMPSLFCNSGTIGVTAGAQTSFPCTPNLAWGSTPRLVIGVFNGASSAIYAAAAGPQGTGDVGAAAMNLTGMTIGANRLLAAGWGTSGTGIIAGAWVWNGALTAGDISSFAAFCLAQWGRGW